MGVQTFKAAKAPDLWLFSLSDEQRSYNRDALLFAAGDDPADDLGDDLDYPDDGRPALDPYSAHLDVTLTVKCDDTLRDWIDAVGAELGFSRSEATRRLIFLGMTKLDGRIERVQGYAQSEAE